MLCQPLQLAEHRWRTDKPHIAGLRQFRNELVILRVEDDCVVRDERNSQGDRSCGYPTIRFMGFVAARDCS
jgi:hypothetical protein